VPICGSSEAFTPQDSGKQRTKPRLSIPTREFHSVTGRSRTTITTN